MAMATATATAAYTCLACRVAFADAALQRAHFRTDWHRYNLQRRVAAMAPVTAEGFRERVRAQRAAAERGRRGAATYCAACGRRFAGPGAYGNHVRSRRHAARERRAAAAGDGDEDTGGEDGVDGDAGDEDAQPAVRARPSPRKVPPAPEDEAPPRLRWLERRARNMVLDGDDWEDIDSDDDLDCDDAESMDELEQEAEEEAAGVGAPLGAIPVTDCLFCPHHSSSLTKNVAHMTKVHSFFIPDIEYLSDLKGLIRYLGEKVGVGKICLWCNEKGKSFYSTEAVQAHMNDKSHCKLLTEGDAALEFADFYDFRSSYPDHKDGEESPETDELSSDKTLEYDDETMELILPSGARVGHRSLMRYYKQRFGLSRAVAVAKNQKAVGRVLQQYRALGWTDSTGAALRSQQDMQYVQRMKAKWMLKTGMKNNATKQMHFRAQVVF